MGVSHFSDRVRNHMLALESVVIFAWSAIAFSRALKVTEDHPNADRDKSQARNHFQWQHA